jgi:class 3 adenylate cyclase
MTQVIQDSNGAIELYVGDQVTALFGLEHNCTACNPEDCLRCGLNMQTIIKYSLNPYFTSIGLPTISCSIGMDFGTIWLAKVGIKGSNQLTLVGYIVNVAAQLVDIAGYGQIFLGQNLYNRILEHDQGLCVPKTNPDWRWQLNNAPYRFFHYNAQWPNYSLS